MGPTDNLSPFQLIKSQFLQFTCLSGVKAEGGAHLDGTATFTLAFTTFNAR